MKCRYDSRIGILLLLAFILGISYVDYASGFKFSLFPLYLIPIALISWNEKITVTILSSVLASIIILIKDIYYRTLVTDYAYWDLFIKILLLFITSFMIWKIRNLIIENDRAVGELRQSLSEIQELREMIPICAWCHSVRNDEGFYEKIESYLNKHTGSKLTHGICPSCVEKYYGHRSKQSDGDLE